MAAPIAVPVGTSPSQLWSGRNTTSINTLLLINTDLVNTVTVGSSLQSIVVPIPPNGSLSVDPVENWYVVGQVPGIAPVVVVPNGQASFRSLTQAAGQLALPEFISPNYSPGVAGWAVFKNGNAEFNNLTIRGTFHGTNFVIDSNGIFFFSGPPASGNLIASIANTSGTEPYGGNPYLGAPNALFAAYNFGSTLAISFGSNNIVGWHLAGGVWNQGAVLIAQYNVGLGQGFWEFFSTTLFDQPVTFKLPVTMNHQASPPAAIAGDPQVFGSALGALHVIDGADGNEYTTERITQVRNSNSPSLVALTTMFIQACGVRTYRIQCDLLVDVAVANAQVSCAVIDTAGTATGHVDITVVRAATFFGCTSGNVNATNTVAINLPAANGYIVKLNCTISVIAAGNISVQFGSATAQAIVIEQYSTMEYMPS